MQQYRLQERSLSKEEIPTTLREFFPEIIKTVGPELAKQAYIISEFSLDDKLIGYIVLGATERVFDIHINIIKKSKEVFAQLKLWFDNILVPQVRKSGRRAIVCNDSGYGNPKFKTLIEDFGFKTKTVIYGEYRV